MFSDELLDGIVKRVLEKLDERMKSALVVFTGASIGFKEVIPQLRALSEDGWHLKVVLSNSAEYVLTPQLIKKMLGVEKVYPERETKALSPLYRDVGLIIFPTLSLNTAVKIALGVADSLPTNLAAHALMEGIPLVAVRNACDLKNYTRLQLGMNKTPKDYMSRMEQYLNTLEDYGIELTEAETLYEKVAGGYGRKSTASGRKKKKEVYHFNKKVLSRIDVIDAKNADATLFISRNTIVTNLAFDTAKELGVEIVRE